MSTNLFRPDADLDSEAPVLDPVRLYLDAIGKVPLLDAAQEVELSKRIEAGLFAQHKLEQADAREIRLRKAQRADLEELVRDGERAKDHLLRANLRLVVSVAKRYTRTAMPLLDIVQEGNLGLVRAVEKFDYRKGYKFSTYAMWWIRQAISRGLAEQSRTVRLPVHVVEDVNKIARARRELEAVLDGTPTVDQVATQAGLTVERVTDLDRVARDPISLDVAVGDDGDASFGDFVMDTGAAGPDELAVRAEQARALDLALLQLDRRSADIVRRRFGLHDGSVQTHDAIGKQLGLSRERVRQIEKAALEELRAGSALAELNAA
ncbi:MAG TPA: sigma-70 family RNA polymerase sigma factor [Mycobacteriales bacterium]|nr:sigma-70 family RNA polymerase sigma factor [Mycobacteriales bacterium]